MNTFRVRLTITAAVAALLHAGYGASASALQSPAQIVDSVAKERRSNGFEVRLKISSLGSDGQRSGSVKLAIIGQVTAERERLHFRGISPDNVHDRRFASEKGADGRIRLFEIADDRSGAVTEIDPSSRLFDTGLVLWDMFAPWWNWPTHRFGASERVAGRQCTIVQSESGSDSSAIRAVSSCIDRDAKLSLRTQLFDRERALIRTILVERLVRKESGAMAAKQLRIIAAGHLTTEIEVYGGDENYFVTPDTFAALQISSQLGSRDH